MLLHSAPALSRVVGILLAPADRVLTAPAVQEGVTRWFLSLQPTFLPTAALLCTPPAQPRPARWSGLLEGCGKWHSSGWGFVGKGPTDLQRHQELGRLCSKCCTSVVFQVNEENIQP